MRLKRILSFLLSTLLVISSIPMTVFASSGETAASDEDVWTAVSGAKELEVVTIDEAALATDESGDDYFYRFYNLTGEDGATYTTPSGSVASARYKVSLWLRAVPQINEAANEDLVPGDADATSLPTLRFICRGWNNNTYQTAFNITTEWQKYEAVIVAGASTAITLQCHYNGAEDIVPFDVCGVSFTPVDGDNQPNGETFTVNGTWTPKNSGNKILTVKKSDEVYNHIVIPTTETTVNVDGKDFNETVPVTTGLGFTTALVGSDDVTLAPGKYTLTGSFRLGWFDHAKLVMKSDKYHISENNNTALLKAYSGTTNLGEITINPSAWTDISYSFVITEPTAMSKIKFELGEIVSLDYKDLVLKLTHTISDEIATAEGEPLYLHDVESADEYIRISGRDHYNDWFCYKDTTKTWNSSDTYVISFKVRTDAFIESTVSAVGYNPSTIRAGKSAGTRDITNWIRPGAEWTNCSYEVTGFTGGIYFMGSGNCYSAAPIDIKDLTIVKKGTTENLASNPNGELNGGAGWSIAQDMPGIKTLSVSAQTEQDYTVIPAVSGENTSFKLIGEDTLEAGVYFVSGEFKVTEIDYNKYNFADYATLTSDGNVTPLGVTVGGTALKTADGGTRAEITPENYTQASFKLVVNEGDEITKDDIVFTAYGEVSLGARNITITDASDMYSTEFVDENGEALIYVTPENEDTYIRISGRDHNNDRFSYTNTTTTWDAEATYLISFKARTDPYIESDTIKFYPAVIRAGKTNGTNNISNWMPVSADWSDFGPYEVTGFIGGIYFMGSGQGVGFAPIDIKDLTIIKKGESENLATNANGLLNEGAGWSIVQDMPGIKLLKVTEMPDGKYLAASSASGTKTEFSYASDEILEPGIYHITGEYIVKNAVIDYNKYEFAGDYETLLSDGNVTDFGISAGGVALETPENEASVKISSEGWTKATFKLLVSEGANIAKSDIIFAADGAAALGIRNVKIENASSSYNIALVDGEGRNPIIVNDNADGAYVRVTGRDHNEDQLVYDAGTLDEGTYTVSLKARTVECIPSEDGAVATNPASIRMFANVGSSSAVKTLPTLTSEGQEVIFTDAFTVSAGGSTVSFIFRGNWTGFGFAPFDIYDFKIVKNGTETNVASNASALRSNGTGWSIVNSDRGDQIKNLNVEIVDDLTYNRVSAPSGGNTELSFVSNETLIPGVYHISGRFRMTSDVIDYNKYEGNSDYLTADGNMITAAISASASGVELHTLSGAQSTSLADYYWKDVTFVLDTEVAINMNQIKLMLDGAYALDFADVNIELIETKRSIGDVNIGTIMTLLVLKAKQTEELGLNAAWSANGKVLDVVDGVLDEALGAVGDKNGTASNSYVHIYNRDHNSDRIVYENRDMDLSAGTYRLTFWARTAEFDNISRETSVAPIRIFLGDDRTSIVNISSSKSGAFYRDPNCLDLSDKWQKYSFTFTLNSVTDFKFIIRGNGYGNGVAPFDIDAFTLVALDSNGKPVTGENLAKNGDKPITGNAGWYANDTGDVNVPLTIVSATESAYMTTGNTSSGELMIKNTGAYIEAGKYYITAKVRLSAIDYLKYDYMTADQLKADNNKANLRASFAGAALKTVDGEDSVVVTPEWNVETFVLDVPAKSSMKSIRMMLDSNCSLDFDYINIDTKVSTYDIDAIGIGADGKPIMPPITSVAADNLVKDSVSAEQLGYWHYGDQTLEVKNDENGNTYFAAGNITDNTLGFTYEPGFEIPKGSYKFSGYFRTANEGETPMLRVMLGEDSFASATLTDEWQLIELTLDVESDIPLSLKLRGGPRVKNVQDYEFKDLCLVDANYYPSGTEFVKDGGFDDAELALSSWRIALGGVGNVNVNEEDGNAYLAVSERGDSFHAIQSSIGFNMTPGDTYTISFDIRTSVEGETMTGRTRIGTTALNGVVVRTNTYAAENDYIYEITNEWHRIEHTFTATEAGPFIISILGGPRGEPDNKDFDIDNVSIVKN